jgi:hypothetical protein
MGSPQALEEGVRIKESTGVPPAQTRALNNVPAF